MVEGVTLACGFERAVVAAAARDVPVVVTLCELSLSWPSLGSWASRPWYGRLWGVGQWSVQRVRQRSQWTQRAAAYCAYHLHDVYMSSARAGAWPRSETAVRVVVDG